MDLNEYLYFVHVVEQQGFASAGRALGVPKSRLSRHVQQLEERLGARLIQRSSRRFVVTDVGQTFYRHARAVLDEVDVAEVAVKRQTNSLSGKVRMSCSVGMAQFALSDVITKFMTNHPKIEVIQQVTNQQIDILEAGIDMAIRGHANNLPDSRLMQRRLVVVPWYVMASPAYLERAGTPAVPNELEEHPGLNLGWHQTSSQWSLGGPNKMTAVVPCRPRLLSDDMVTLKKAAVDGLGVVALPGYVCREELKAGRLVRILPDWTAGQAQISLLMPSRKGLLPAVEALSGYLRSELPLAVQI